MLIHSINIQPARLWSLSEDQIYLKQQLESLGIHFTSLRIAPFSKYLYLSSKYQLLKLARIPYHPFQRYFLDYFHGGCGYSCIDFDSVISNMLRIKHSIQRVRVTSARYRDFLASRGFPLSKLQIIPLPVSTEEFASVSCNERLLLRKMYNIPLSSFVVGSFQKDGNGWHGNFSPKIIKGPDIFCDAIRQLSDYIPDLHVVLSGPVRDYVRLRLSESSVPFTYLGHISKKQLPSLYNITDCYLITSREEGGPKAFLEACSSEVPVVSTDVGQVSDLNTNGSSVFVVNSFDPRAIADTVMKQVYQKDLCSENLISRNIALNYSTTSQLNSWYQFFSVR